MMPLYWEDRRADILRKNNITMEIRFRGGQLMTDAFKEH